MNDSKSIVFRQIYQTSYTNEALCQLEVTYIGLITHLFINGDSVLSDSSLDPLLSKKKVQTRTFYHPKEGALLLTVIGYKIRLFETSIIKCKDLVGNSILVTYDTYYISGTKMPSFDTTYMTGNINCPQGCISCMTNDFLYKMFRWQAPFQWEMP